MLNSERAAEAEEKQETEKERDGGVLRADSERIRGEIRKRKRRRERECLKENQYFIKIIIIKARFLITSVSSALLKKKETESYREREKWRKDQCEL